MARTYTENRDNKHRYGTFPCEMCGKERLIRIKQGGIPESKLCHSCVNRKRERKNNIQLDPGVDFKYGVDLGLKSKSRFIKVACVDCGKERWLELRKEERNLRCGSCVKKMERSYNWKGGKITTSYGYIYVKVYDTSPYYVMANKSGYIFEHRLIMAEYLGRCLVSSEVVHHKNHDRKDNRIENLELFNKEQHESITILEKKIAFLVAENKKLVNALNLLFNLRLELCR